MITAQSIAGGVAAGTTSAETVARDTLARIAAYALIQPAVWIHRVSEADVLASARAVDARIAAGEVLPLAGVPFAIKDNIDLAGSPTTAAGVVRRVYVSEGQVIHPGAAMLAIEPA